MLQKHYTKITDKLHKLWFCPCEYDVHLIALLIVELNEKIRFPKHNKKGYPKPDSLFNFFFVLSILITWVLS